jgi:predicted XRE-type DNA-binding protein
VIPHVAQSLPGQDDEGSARPELISAIADALETLGLSQVQAAKLCRTDQPTLSKVLRGRTESVTLDKLVDWLVALGRSVELRVSRVDATQPGRLRVSVDGRPERE